jgi:hypothetical protein
MSKITETIKQFHDRKITREDLVKKLALWQYKEPTRFKNRPKEVWKWWDHYEAADYEEEGTWDEVRLAMNSGLISEDIYFEIVDYAEEHRK